MEYIYGFDTAGVIDRLAKPLVKNELPAILYQAFGNSWYSSYVKDIMQKYPDYAKLVEDDEEPLKNYDVTAIWYLLFPFENINGEFVRLPGAAEYFGKEKGLNEEQLNKLESMRTLRNGLVHANARRRFLKPDHQAMFHEEEQEKEVDGKMSLVKVLIYDGEDPLQAQMVLHEDALDAIEEAFRPLNQNVSGIVLQKKNQILGDLISNGSLISKPSGKRDVYQPNYSKYVAIIQEGRQQYQGISHSDWSRSPISSPVELPLPWAKQLGDLEDLPWPTDGELSEEAVSAPVREEKEVSNSAADTIVDEAVNLGKSLFKNLFGKK